MSRIGTDGAGGTQQVYNQTGVDGPQTTGSQGAVVPPASGQVQGSAAQTQIPTLKTPIAGKNAEFPLELLLGALSLALREAMADATSEAVKARADQRKEENNKKIEEMIKTLEDKREQSIWDKVGKAFKFIGMILGAIGAAVTIAIGAATANPALIAAGVIMATLVVDSILSEATGGKVSIAAGVAAGMEKLGVAPDIAQYIGMAVQMALAVAAIVLSFGTGAGSAAGTAASAAGSATGSAAAATSTATSAASTASTALTTADKVKQYASMIMKISAIAQGINMVGQGTVQIGSAINQKEMMDSQAFVKEIEAILEQLKMLDSIDIEHIRALLETNQKLLDTVANIVQDIVATASSIASGSPSMA